QVSTRDVSMTVQARLRLQSGDRTALETCVEEIQELARQKGAEFTGPHTDAPEDHRVPIYKRLNGDQGEIFDYWTYTVYSRRIEISGHEELARALLDREFPDSIHVEIELDQSNAPGR
ncbi:MAG: uS10/mL48 family ribosomal protein, partial [Halobacteriaceae archaeon]